MSAKATQTKQNVHLSNADVNLLIGAIGVARIEYRRSLDLYGPMTDEVYGDLYLQRMSVLAEKLTEIQRENECNS